MRKHEWAPHSFGTHIYFILYLATSFDLSFLYLPSSVKVGDRLWCASPGGKGKLAAFNEMLQKKY